MSPADLIHHAKEIERLTSALNWLRAHGADMQPRDKDSFAISVMPIRASALPGANEAERQLTIVARWQIGNIVGHAITDAENTIAIHKDAIRAALEQGGGNER